MTLIESNVGKTVLCMTLIESKVGKTVLCMTQVESKKPVIPSCRPNIYHLGANEMPTVRSGMLCLKLTAKRELGLLHQDDMAKACVIYKRH